MVMIETLNFISNQYHLSEFTYYEKSIKRKRSLRYRQTPFLL